MAIKKSSTVTPITNSPKLKPAFLNLKDQIDSAYRKSMALTTVAMLSDEAFPSFNDELRAAYMEAIEDQANAMKQGADALYQALKHPQEAVA